MKPRIIQGLLCLAATGGLVFGGMVWTGQVDLDIVRGSVENLVDTVYGLNNDRNQLLGHINELNERYGMLSHRNSQLEDLIEYLESQNEINNELINELEDEKLRIHEELASIKDLLSFYQEELEVANTQIEIGQEEINRLEAELTIANESASQLRQDVDLLLERVYGITAGVDIPEIGEIPTPDDEMTVYAQVTANLINANIQGISENVIVYIGNETHYNIRFRVVDTTSDTKWTDNWYTIQQVIDVIRETYGGSHAWANDLGVGEGSIYVQR